MVAAIERCNIPVRELGTIWPRWLGRDRFGQAFLVLAVIWTATMPLSIAVAEIALWSAAALWAVAWVRREFYHPGDAPEPADRGPAGDIFSLIGTPLMAFWCASVISAMNSRAPVDSLWELREIFLFAVPLVTYLAYRDSGVRRLGLLVFAIGTAIAIAVGLAQTFVAVRAGQFPDAYRPDGPLGHYMTYAGTLMLALPVLLIPSGRWIGIASRLLAVSAAMVVLLTMTRSAWTGLAAGLFVYAGCRLVRGRAETDSGAPRQVDPRAAARSGAGYGVPLLVGIIVAIVLLLSLAGSDALLARGASIFSVDNPANLDRLAMAATGLRVVRNHPFLGVGPGLMGRVYPAWAVEWAVKESNPHLHNNALQVAAERGLIGLALWLWLMAAFVVGAWRVLRYSGPLGEGGREARAALAALAAFLVMGQFEYNFSDSEVLMVLLFVGSLPFAASSGIAMRAARPNELRPAPAPQPSHVAPR